MKFSLIICTYKRASALKNLLNSVSKQRLHPDQIVIVDGSSDNDTKHLVKKSKHEKLQYYKVRDKDRGLTRQRNFGISKLLKDIEVVCFLDDDIVLEPDYFRELISTYKKFPDAVGVGGHIVEEMMWKSHKGAEVRYDEHEFDGWVRKLGSRNVLRKRIGLLSDKPPGYMPDFSNGFSTGYLPPSGRIYPVEFFMGGVASYRRFLFDQLNFSHYFNGYGLYEDMDFCLRASRLGQLYVNTAARLYHHHEEGGRPNNYKYGRMVLRNGWYVWRVRYPNPALKSRIKWHATALVLTLVRAANAINTKQRKEALTETLGRFTGWFSLFVKRPGREA